MASDPDVSAMSEEEFYTCLKDKGMIEEDVQTLQKHGYNGKNIFLLNADCQLLSHASKAILKAVFQCDPGKDEADTDIMRSLERQSSDIPDHIKFFRFGLGKGVDASEPSPLATSSVNQAVRFIKDKCNIMENAIKESRSYTKFISSLNRQKSLVKASVSDLVGKVLTLEAEAEYKRENEREVAICGKKYTTRRVSFQPYCHQNTLRCHDEESKFEKKFCEYLIQEIPEIGSEVVPGPAGSEPISSPADKVHQYLIDDSSTRWEEVLRKAFKFIKREKITHYISEIELGAAEYSSSIVTRKCRCKKLEKAAGIEYLAEMRMGMESTQETTHKEKRKLSIGKMESVSRGDGEAVLGYGLLPIFTLVCNEHKNIKKVLQLAVKFYLDRSCGPFLIYCEPSNTIVYWKVNCTGNKKTLTGTPDKNDASIFYIQKQSRSCKFTISHCGESLKSASATQVSNISHYLSVNSKPSRHKGPVQMEGRAAKLTLKHDAKEKEEFSIQDWEEDGYYIKLAPRMMQEKSYLALKFTNGTFESKCVESRNEGGKDLVMRFILKRVESDIGIIMKSRLCSDGAEIPSQPKGTDSSQIDADSASKGTGNTSINQQNPKEDDTFLANLLDIQTSPNDGTEKEDLLKEEDLFEIEDSSDSDADSDYDDSD